MRQLSADKYNVAWFKLAEFVVRGEKERALGLYRLLIHSFEDQAFAYQLEGDILLAFNDQEAACAKYEQAAHAYGRSDRYEQAVAVWENLVSLKSEKFEEYTNRLMGIYKQLALDQKVLEHKKSLITHYIGNKRTDGVLALIQAECVAEQKSCTIDLSVFSLQEYNKMCKDNSVLETFVSKLAEVLIQKGTTQDFQMFLAHVKQELPIVYDYCCNTLGSL